MAEANQGGTRKAFGKRERKKRERKMKEEKKYQVRNGICVLRALNIAARRTLCVTFFVFLLQRISFLLTLFFYLLFSAHFCV
jgi:hypothetical protein